MRSNKNPTQNRIRLFIFIISLQALVLFISISYYQTSINLKALLLSIIGIILVTTGIFYTLRKYSLTQNFPIWLSKINIRVSSYSTWIVVSLALGFICLILLKDLFVHPMPMNSYVASLSRIKYMDISFNGMKSGCVLCGAETPGIDPQPIENFFGAEDLGLMFYLGLLGKLGVTPNLFSYQKFSILMIAIGILISSGLLGYVFRSKLSGISIGVVFLLFFKFLIIQDQVLFFMGYWIGPWSSMLSICLAIFLMRIDLAYVKDKKGRKISRTLAFCLWGLITGFSYLCRSEFGIISAVSSLLILVFTSPRNNYWYEASLSLFVFLLSFFIMTSPFYYILSYRQSIFQLPPVNTNNISTHGIWHNLYIGLGYIPNRWNIEWDDQNGIDFAKENCPDAVYPDDQYYNCIKQQTLFILHQDPWLLARNLILKSYVILLISLPLLIEILVISIILNNHDPKAILILTIIWLFYQAPGLLAVPKTEYIIGSNLALLGLCLFIPIDYFYRLRAFRNKILNSV